MLKKYFSLNLAVFLLFILDRTVKFYFIKNPAKIFGGDFLSLDLATNKGVAFGIGFNQIILLGLIGVVITILFNFLSQAYAKNDLVGIFALTSVIFGAISNLIDRIRYGFVIDYIDVSWFTVFNLADIMITVGSLILIVDVFFSKKK